MKTNKKDNLEQFIADNEDLFNHHTPSEALKQRIKNELSNNRDQRKNISVKKVGLYQYSAAAAVLAAVFLLIFFYTRNKNERSGYQAPVVTTDGLLATDSNRNKEMKNTAMPTDTQNHALVTEKNEDIFPEEVNGEELYHYTRLIEIKQQQIEALKQTAPELYREFAGDMKILENSYKELKEQLRQAEDKEQLLEAMIDNLKMQAALLGRQLEIYKETHRKKENTGTSISQSFPLYTSNEG